MTSTMATTVSFAYDGLHFWAHDGIQVFHISGEISIVVNKPGWTLENDQRKTPLIPGRDERFDSKVSFKIHSPTKATIEYDPSNSSQALEESVAACEAAMSCLQKMAAARYENGAETEQMMKR